MKRSKGPEVSRVEILQAVRTPLGFFVLLVLIVEVILGLVTGLSSGTDRTYLIFGMLALIFLLVGIVSIIAVFRPEALYGRRPPVTRRPAASPAVMGRSYFFFGAFALLFLFLAAISVIAVFRPEAIYRRPSSVADRPSTGGVETGSGDTLPPFESIADSDTPVVLSVAPSPGSVVDPGPVLLRAAFSMPMRQGWSFVKAARGDMPALVEDPVVSRDGRTITARIFLEPGRDYAFWLNAEKHRNFCGQNGKPAVPYFVSFRTSDGHKD